MRQKALCTSQRFNIGVIGTFNYNGLYSLLFILKLEMWFGILELEQDAIQIGFMIFRRLILEIGTSMNEFREWTMWLAEWFIVVILIAEYFYDKEKDDKKQRRTRTTKKATTMPDGTTVTEENTETTELKGNKNE